MLCAPCEAKNALDFNTVEMAEQFILEIPRNWGPAKHNHNRFLRMFNHQDYKTN